MPFENVTLKGHIIDSQTLVNALDDIVAVGATYEIMDLEIGTRREEHSSAKIRVTADSDEVLEGLLDSLSKRGASFEKVVDARLETADADGAFPPGFYSSTNLETEVRVAGGWIRVTHPEMDCGIVVEGATARTIPMGEVTSGMQIVMRGPGIRVLPLDEGDPAEKQAFEFMSSDVSSEKPKALLVDRVADQMRRVKSGGKRILWVAGPAVVHTGSAPDVCALIRGGYVDGFFAGNGVAAHDIESNMFGTSLGVNLGRGTPEDHGHEHHIRAINELRRRGSFQEAIDAGIFSDGIVHHLVTHGCDYLFGGSVRDDGPLPEVVTDMLEVQRKLREIIWGRDGDDLIGYCIVVGTMLHGIATGNCLPASVPLVCVDINQATVTKLMDRGSWQSVGIITDVGLFIRELSMRLTPEEVRPIGEEAHIREAGSQATQ